jgi:deoxycytidylate deaminase
MKAAIISNIDEIADIKTKAVVISFRPSFDDILQLIASGIKIIQINTAADNSLSKNSRNLLKHHGIELRVGNIQGLKKDFVEI